MIFDLDNTLIYTSKLPLLKCDHTFTINWKGDTYSFFVKFRPNLIQTLISLSKQFELVLFSAAEDTYVRDVVKQIEIKA